MKQFLLKIYTWSLLSSEKTNYHQKIARDSEWESIKPFMKTGKFLDIGAGAGYSMKKAQEDFNCEVFGIDPDPQGHGVGRNGSNFETGVKVIKGYAENIPFDEKTFDIVYSSHVLEHVRDNEKALSEMKRICKDDGVIIIIVPSSTMAYINWISNFLFRTHITIVNLVFNKLFTTGKSKWWELFVPCSHSFPQSPIFYDLKHYKKNVWKRKIMKHLKINTILLPFLYPFPEYIQWFKSHKNSKFSSSIIFVCTK